MNPRQHRDPATPDVVVAGAGIVGLACAWAALREGLRVTVVDRDFAGDRVSHGNAGGIGVTECTPIAVSGIFFKAPRWLCDPLGPLSVRWRHLPAALPWFMALSRSARAARYREIALALAALNRRVYDDLVPMLDDIGAAAAFYRRGALTVYETERAFLADAGEWALKRELGVRWEHLEAPALRAFEPALAPAFQHGVYLPDWSHVGDPAALVARLRQRIVELGGTLVTGAARALDAADAAQPTLVLGNGTRLAARHIVVALGAWSGQLAASLGDRVLLESERGYNTTLPQPGIQVSREIIFAERKFVATPLDVGLRIGGAAEFAGLEAAPNFQRSDALLTLGRRFFPGLDDARAHKWMGHRPATPDSLPVIGRSPHADNVIYAFGHGHLGLTQAATSAALVADLLQRRAPRLALEPYSIARFSGRRP